MSRSAATNGTAALAVLLVISASARFALRRRRVRAAAQLWELVARNRDSFLRVRLKPEVFARWSDASHEYHTVTGVRGTLVGRDGPDATRGDEDGESIELSARVGVEYGELVFGPGQEGPTQLLAPENEPVWILGRVVRASEEDATFRSAGVACLEPILDRFVIVADHEGPYAPRAELPSWARWVLYPLSLAVTMVVLAATADDASMQLAWVVGLVVVAGFVEMFAWVWFTSER